MKKNWFKSLILMNFRPLRLRLLLLNDNQLKIQLKKELKIPNQGENIQIKQIVFILKHKLLIKLTLKLVKCLKGWISSFYKDRITKMAFFILKTLKMTVVNLSHMIAIHLDLIHSLIRIHLKSILIKSRTYLTIDLSLLFGRTMKL